MTPEKNRFPSEEELAKKMAVSRATIREALKMLMRDGAITTIHGKGTFAHPSVYNIKNRLDLTSDLNLLLKDNYKNVDVVSEAIGYHKPTRYYKEQFGENVENPFSFSITYLAGNKNILYCIYEVCPDFINKKLEKISSNINGFQKFSSFYMKNLAVSCCMRIKIKNSKKAIEKLNLDKKQALICLDEVIYDIDDNIVAIGVVYSHPDKLQFSLLTQFESN